ncbi:hypothetical protein [Thiothrix lacustris]|uniref:hypothetical protein n=1 Tax=Thiothrix lacustris TaxID=525917 RepID=UPI0027E43359|nr:hypothetical protein [Thiothrix lacustris]WMP17348.1 hypothetical protein RCS87_18465 [Thiothrix lacustris]
MYEDKNQWARFIYSVFNAIVVYYLVQPAQIEQFSRWANGLNSGAWIPLTQLTFYIVSIGLIFPKSKRLEILHPDGRTTSDFKQLVIGMFISAAAWFMSLL